jgi:catecholate siderophore receptor
VTKQDTKVVQGLVTSTTNQNGQPINFSPELTFTSWTTYSLPFGLTIGGGIRYVDSQSRTLNGLLTSANANLREIPSYYVIDAAIGYGITERVSVQLNLYNLTDEDYLDQVNNSGQRYTPGRPLSGVLSVAVGL